MKRPPLYQIIDEERERRGWSINRLATDDRVTCARTRVYAFLNGEAQLGSDSVDELLEALSIEVVPPRAG